MLAQPHIVPRPDPRCSGRRRDVPRHTPRRAPRTCALRWVELCIWSVAPRTAEPASVAAEPAAAAAAVAAVRHVRGDDLLFHAFGVSLVPSLPLRRLLSCHSRRAAHVLRHRCRRSAKLRVVGLRDCRARPARRLQRLLHLANTVARCVPKRGLLLRAGQHRGAWERDPRGRNPFVGPAFVVAVRR